MDKGRKQHARGILDDLRLAASNAKTQDRIGGNSNINRVEIGNNVLSLSKLPQYINKLAFIISIDGNGSMKDIYSLKLDISQHDNLSINMILDGSYFQNEKTLIIFEIYRKDG